MSLNIPGTDDSECFELLCQAAIWSKKAYPVYLQNESPTGLKNIKVFQDATTGIDGYIGQNNENDVVIAFSGTEPFSLKDWRTVGTAGKEYSEFLKGEVHKGFLQAYNSVRQDIIQYLYYTSRSEKIECVGHSMGGALAELCCIDLLLMKEECRSWTFGAPAYLSPKLAKHVKENFSYALCRVVHEGDIVPYIGQCKGYMHASNLIYLDDNGGIEYQSKAVKSYRDVIGKNIKSVSQRFKEIIEDHDIHSISRLC
jgi:hypothetical protein